MQQHDLRLVALAAVICLLGCFTTVTLLARGQAAGRRSLRSAIAAAVVFGTSVWSLHFVAMLAYMPGLEIGYSVGTTVASMGVAILGALAAFLVQRQPMPLVAQRPIAGALLATGVSGMHYLGAAAMRFSGFALFDVGAIVASVIVCAVLAAGAMWRGEQLARVSRRLEATAWLTVTICSLHFTGMSALTIVPGEAVHAQGTILGSSTIAFVLGTVTLSILVVCLAATLLEKHMSDRAVVELGRMRRLSNLTHEALLIHREGRIVEVNTAGERLLGELATDLIGKAVPTLFSEQSLPALCRRERRAPSERQAEEMEIIGTDGRLITVELSCEPIDYMGRPATAMSLRDLTDRKRDEARIRHLARHDPLTNTCNRFSLQERLDIALERAGSTTNSFAVLYFDLDRFKPVNDLHGHAAGDALLIAVAKRVRGEIEPEDTLARIGGDEFVILQMNAAKPEKAAALASRVLSVVQQPFAIEGQTVSIGASIGIAVYPNDGDTADALLRSADTAMYRVKAEGRGNSRFFEPSMNAQLQARRQLEQDLRDAVRLNQLTLHYQPMVNGATGELETFEALVRWEHPVRGRVPPLDFIPIAEDTGAIEEIGRWVIETACREAARWPQPWRVSVNISPAQFRKTDICSMVGDALARYALAANRLVLEITEGVLIHDAVQAVEILNRLRGMGIRLALDDFGTGYSSLSYLQAFRFDKFKIDKSFIQRLGENEDALTITRTIINLGHNLGLHVTAEGVETVQQLRTLQAFGCDQIQGYLIGRPSKVEAFTEGHQARTRVLFSAGTLQRSA